MKHNQKRQFLSFAYYILLYTKLKSHGCTTRRVIFLHAPIDVIKMLGVIGTQGTSVVARWTSVRHDLVNIHMCILMYPLVFSV